MSVKAPQEPSFETLWEGSHFAVLNKPAGVHSEPWVEEVSGGRWHAVHRLDRLTSGVLLVAESEWVARLRPYFQNTEKIKKIYLAGPSRNLEMPQSYESVHGFVLSRHRSSKKVEFSNRQPTHPERYHSVQDSHHLWRKAPETIDFQSLGFLNHPAEVWLKTGRRHQIRSFFKYLGAPINGDPLYGSSASGGQRLELHAWRLEVQLKEIHHDLDFSAESSSINSINLAI